MSKTYKKNAANNYDDRPKQPETTFKEDLIKGRQVVAEFEKKQKADRLKKAATTPLPSVSWFTGMGRLRRTRRVLTKKLRKRTK